jgi:hypothetical protein
VHAGQDGLACCSSNEAQQASASKNNPTPRKVPLAALCPLKHVVTCKSSALCCFSVRFLTDPTLTLAVLVSCLLRLQPAVQPPLFLIRAIGICAWQAGSVAVRRDAWQKHPMLPHFHHVTPLLLFTDCSVL